VIANENLGNQAWRNLYSHKVEPSGFKSGDAGSNSVGPVTQIHRAGHVWFNSF